MRLDHVSAINRCLNWNIWVQEWANLQNVYLFKSWLQVQTSHRWGEWQDLNYSGRTDLQHPLKYCFIQSRTLRSGSWAFGRQMDTLSSVLCFPDCSWAVFDGVTVWWPKSLWCVDTGLPPRIQPFQYSGRPLVDRDSWSWAWGFLGGIFLSFLDNQWW